jgi:hypothetical protein
MNRKRSGKNTCGRSCRPEVELLEDRCVPSGSGVHRGITTTWFYVGEPATPANGFIANAASAWDDLWQQHYGGVDDPVQRSGFFPARFTPQENPFYFALPYDDLGNNGARKAGAAQVIPWARRTHVPPGGSLLKNHWIKITAHGRVAYAQWEDVGPFLDNDAAYVFGGARPGNTAGAHAGLDVSPGVRDFLGLGDVSRTRWQFVNAGQVPPGPWAQIVTTSQVFFT